MAYFKAESTFAGLKEELPVNTHSFLVTAFAKADQYSDDTGLGQTLIQTDSLIPDINRPNGEPTFIIDVPCWALKELADAIMRFGQSQSVDLSPFGQKMMAKRFATKDLGTDFDVDELDTGSEWDIFVAAHLDRNRDIRIEQFFDTLNTAELDV
jgi:hypothetical protein